MFVHKKGRLPLIGSGSRQVIRSVYFQTWTVGVRFLVYRYIIWCGEYSYVVYHRRNKMSIQCEHHLASDHRFTGSIKCRHMHYHAGQYCVLVLLFFLVNIIRVIGSCGATVIQ